MKLGCTIIYVKDVIATMDFYEKAFGLSKKFLSENEFYGEMDTGATTLSFLLEERATEHAGPVRVNDAAKDPCAFEIAFVCDDVHSAYKKAIDAGAYSHRAPEEKPWGQKVAYVRDLNGVLVELCSPVG
jgi:uncharacterized glyoxalase superfamily protein PhnB